MTAPTERATNAITARLFMRELDARGVDCEPALVAAGLTREILSGARAEIAWSQMLCLIDSALQLTASDELGVLAGERIELADLDLAGLYLRSASSGGDAFRFHRDHPEVFEPSTITRMHTTRDAVVITIPAMERTAARAALAECVLASALKLVPAIAGPVTPLEVCFRHDRPARDAAHVRVFGNVRWASQLDALFLPIELVDRPLPHRDDTTRAVLEPHIARLSERAKAARDADLPTRVLTAIREELAEGRTAVDALAKRLRLSPRSLRRALAALDTSYSDLLAEVRRELALQHAHESPRISGPELAQRLGYADAHTFYRAFKRWTGVSLSAYRAAQPEPSVLEVTAAHAQLPRSGPAARTAR